MDYKTWNHIQLLKKSYKFRSQRFHPQPTQRDHDIKRAMTKDTIFQMESAHQSSSRINKFKSIPRHITVKLQQNTEYKILKATKEKR